MAKLRTHSEPLPRSIDLIISLFKRAVQLQNVMKIEVTPEEFVVTREMDDDSDEPVLPKSETSVDADIEYVLARVTEDLVEAPFDPQKHPYIALAEATDRLSRDRLRVCGIMVPKGSLFADYFGLPEGSMPETFMGIRIIYHVMADKYPDKIVVFGGPTVYFNDATHGVIIDTGV